MGEGKDSISLNFKDLRFGEYNAARTLDGKFTLTFIYTDNTSPDSTDLIHILYINILEQKFL